MALPSSPVASSWGGTFLPPCTLFSSSSEAPSESPYSFALSPTLHFARGAVLCTPEHPPGCLTLVLTDGRCVFESGPLVGLMLHMELPLKSSFLCLAPEKEKGTACSRFCCARGLSCAGILFLQLKPHCSSALKVYMFLLGERPVSAPC